jgi:hypothetical protein
MLNQEPVLDLVGDEIEEKQGQLSDLRFVRGKTAEKLIRKHTQIGLNKSGHEGDNLHEESKSICGYLSVGVIGLLGKDFDDPSVEPVLTHFRWKLLGNGSQLRKSSLSCLPFRCLTNQQQLLKLLKFLGEGAQLVLFDRREFLPWTDVLFDICGGAVRRLSDDLRLQAVDHLSLPDFIQN